MGGNDSPRLGFKVKYVKNMVHRLPDAYSLSIAEQIHVDFYWDVTTNIGIIVENQVMNPIGATIKREFEISST